MKRNIKPIVQTIAVGGLVLIISITCWLKPATAESVTERRSLAQFPKLSLASVFNASGDTSFMSEFEDYTLDQFPLRDTFRTLKALSAYYIYGLDDNNGYYIQDGVISNMDYQINDDSITYACNKLTELYESKLKDKADNIYISVIPDKNSFTAENSNHLSFDNDRFVSQVREKNAFAEYIDILPLLSADDYYATDTHWRQESIIDVAQALAQAMGTSIPTDYSIKVSDIPFYGVYYGQAAMNVKPDTLKWLTNETIDNFTAHNHSTNSENAIYDIARLSGKDPYEVFLSGGKTAPITIYNPNATTDKELIVFRDSFGSSIAPLLAQGYKALTVIDLRVTSYQVLDQITDATDKDVLFLYSTLVLNNNIEGGERFK